MRSPWVPDLGLGDLAIAVVARYAPAMDRRQVRRRRFFVISSRGGFGSRVISAKTRLAKLKQRLADVGVSAITGIAHFAELSENRGIFRAEEFSWEGISWPSTIGNGRQARGGIRFVRTH